MQQRKSERRELKVSLKQQLLKIQENEITEYFVYSRLADLVPERKNKSVLQKIANEERKHSDFWSEYTGKKGAPNRLKVFFHTLIARILGFTFAVKLMEKGEEKAQVNYEDIAKDIPTAKAIEKEEDNHEKQLLGLLDEEKLKYVGSMVLGVNDALVELTGALAGLTLALQNARLIAMTGLITGIAASLSMGASEYLATKTEAQDKDPLKASVYTGIMYILTVTFLIAPYYLFKNLYLSLVTTLTVAMVIILCFTFYISVAQDLSFKRRFLEMAGISLGVSLLTFGIGYLVRALLGVEI